MLCLLFLRRFLYIAAELHSHHVAASVTGHCDNLTSNVWTGTPVLPYFDDDFEVFIDASQDMRTSIFHRKTKELCMQVLTVT